MVGPVWDSHSSTSHKASPAGTHRRGTGSVTHTETKVLMMRAQRAASCVWSFEVHSCRTSRAAGPVRRTLLTTRTHVELAGCDFCEASECNRGLTVATLSETTSASYQWHTARSCAFGSECGEGSELTQRLTTFSTFCGTLALCGREQIDVPRSPRVFRLLNPS